MNAGKAIYYLLSNASSVTDICGTRIYPELAEQEAPTPFVVYEVISVDPDDTNDGPAKMDEVSIDITAVADSYDTCADLASAIRSAIDRVRGTYNGVNVDSIQYSTTDTDVFDSPRRYAMTAGFIIRISRDDAQIATGQPIDLLTILRLADTPSTYGTEGQALVMNAAGDALEWGETASALGSLTDVNLDDPQDHEALVYDQDTATWINGASTKIGIRVINQTGSTLFAGTPLRATGVQGDQITVEVYNATQDSRRFIGMLSADLANGETGYARQTGAIYHLNTLRFNVGDILYPSKEFRVTLDNGLEFMDSSFGSVGSNEPFAKIPCAIVLRRHFTTGRVYVRTWTPSRGLEDLDNVYTVGKQMNDVLKWNGFQWTAGDQLIPSLNDLRDVEITDPELLPNKSLLRWDAFDGIWRVIPETGGTIPALPNNIAYFLGRYNDGASTARQAADATLTIERYLSVQADGHGEEVSAQTDTPTSGNKIVRKIWHKAVSFEDSDVSTWTLVHTFADDTDYNDTIATFNALLTAATYGSIPFSLAQTWEDVPAFSGLLDTYTGAAAAYSLRLLDSTYTGDAIRVRRASDNAEQDIGFDDNELDTAALATFCSGTDGFVKTWYDQSGNANDATQTTTSAQPKIYDASAGVVTENGKPAVEFNGTSFTMSASANLTGAVSIFLVYRRNTTAGNYILDGQNSTRLAVGGVTDTGQFQVYVSSGVGGLTDVLNQQNLGYVLADGANSEVALNGNTATTGDSGNAVNTSTIYFGARLGSSSWLNGKIQEVVYYDFNQTSPTNNRTGIEANINDFYSIY
jgi:hypothetical protein